jgi:hypothetical protein
MAAFRRTASTMQAMPTAAAPSLFDLQNLNNKSTSAKDSISKFQPSQTKHAQPVLDAEV